MNCMEIDPLLDDLIDGELDRETAPRVAEHLESCPACREKEKDLRRIREMAGNLSREADPPRDLWPGIRERIAPATSGGSRGRMTLYLAAAAVLLTAVLAFAVFRLGGTDPATGPVATVDPALQTGTAEILATYDQVVDDYKKTRDALRAQLDARKGELDPATVEVIEKNLDIMDQAAGEIRLALSRDPGNRGLERMMLASYRKQVDLMRQAIAIPSGM